MDAVFAQAPIIQERFCDTLDETRCGQTAWQNGGNRWPKAIQFGKYRLETLRESPVLRATCQSGPYSCYRGKMAKDDLAKLEGIVVEARGGGTFVVRLENGQELAAKLGGGMRRFRIRVIVGDRVTVGVSPYDPSHGLILFRAKNES